MKRDSGPVVAVRFSALGDVVLATAAVAALRRTQPDTEVILMTKRKFAALAELLPQLTVWPISDDAGVADLVVAARKLRALRPRYVADLHGTLRAMLLRALTPDLYWRGIDKRSLRRWVWTRGGPADHEATHIVLRFGAALGVAPTPGPWIPATRTPPTGRRIAVVPGAAWASKRWPIERYRAAVRRWREAGLEVVWVGGRAEAAEISAAQAECGGDAAIDLSPRDLVDVLAGVDVVVGNDTGVVHLAAAVGTPAVVLLGPTVQGFGYTPWGAHEVIEVDLGCRPCSPYGTRQCPRGHHRCMLDIQVETVVSAALRWATHPSPPGQVP
jgi:heptosyltransferase-2